MDWDKVLSTLGSLSPVVGTAIGGPAGAAIGLGVKGLISLITGSNDQQTALQILQADPNKLLELEEKTKELQLQTYQATLADRQDARKTMVSLTQANSAIAWGPVIVSILVLAGFFTCVDLVFLAKSAFTAEQAQLLNQLFGALVVMATGVVQFWIGSTRGSQNKDLTIANSVPADVVKQITNQGN